MQLYNKSFTYKDQGYSLREAYSASMPGYIYHVLTLGDTVIEVPCLSDGHNIAEMLIDGKLKKSDQIRYTGQDERQA
jgi:hypothetical protein